MPLTGMQRRGLAHLVHPGSELEALARAAAPVIVRGDGVHVVDETGKRYLEACAGQGAAAFGFSEKRLADAADRQMRALPYYHLFNRTHPPAIELAEALVRIAPGAADDDPLTRVLLLSSGAEANDTAIRLVWSYFDAIGQPARRKIITFDRSSHGNTVATASVSGLPWPRDGSDPIRTLCRHAPTPHAYRAQRDDETEAAFAARMLAALEALILTEGPETIAAFLAEPVQIGGGVLVPPSGYFPQVEALLRRFGILIVIDEVLTGFGRTGPSWGCEVEGVRPDMLTCARALSAAYQPIAALLMREPIHDVLRAQNRRFGVFDGGSHGAHPVACAVAIEALRIYEADAIAAHVGRVSPVFLAALAALRTHPLVGDVRGIGLAAGVELVADQAQRTPFDPARRVGARVAASCQAVGLMVGAVEDCIVFTPPLIIREPEIEELAARFRRGLDAVWEEEVNAGAG